MYKAVKFYYEIIFIYSSHLIIKDIKSLRFRKKRVGFKKLKPTLYTLNIKI